MSCNLAVTQSILERYRHLLHPDEFAQLDAVMQRPLLPSLRVNTLKLDVEDARRKWPAWYGWKVQSVPFCETGWQLSHGGENLSRTLEHRMGQYYIQDAASMLPAELFDHGSTPRPIILDMAASPGGKTTHLACKTNDNGLIIANDTSGGRLGALRSNLQDWGAMGTAITNFPGERFGNWFPETFDMVLLDAPCSGESLRTAERRKTRPVSPKERLQLHHRQAQLLTSAFQALKPGGQVVYATCTLAPEEDEAVVNALLDLYPRAVSIEDVSRSLPIPAPGLTTDGEREFSAELRKSVRLWPHLYDTSGFFAALIRKIDSVGADAQVPPARTPGQAGLEQFSAQARTDLITQLRHRYGFDLEAILERQGLTLWQRHKSVYAMPQLWLDQFARLPCVAVGMRIGESTDEFVPSHELVARFEAQFSGRRLRLAEEPASKWLAGYDLRGQTDAPYPSGTIVIVEDDRRRFLGRGKVLRDRIRNLLPKR